MDFGVIDLGANGTGLNGELKLADFGWSVVSINLLIIGHGQK